MRRATKFSLAGKTGHCCYRAAGVIAIGSGWWLPWNPAAIDLQQRLGRCRLARRLAAPIYISAGIFSHACWSATRVSLGAVMACLLLVLL